MALIATPPERHADVCEEPAMSIRLAANAPVPRSRDSEPTPTRPAPLAPARVLQTGRPPAQLSFFFKRA
jgi:hypothetical protein